MKRNPMMTTVNVHGPDVLKVTELVGLGVSAIELGRKDTETTTASVFVDDDRLVDFLVDLVTTADVAKPGVLADVLDKIQ